jgi:hypothetical protein
MTLNTNARVVAFASLAYVITREQDPHLALVALCCRLIAGPAAFAAIRRAEHPAL